MINLRKRIPLANVRCLMVCKERYNRSLLRSVIINSGIKGDAIVDVEKISDIYHSLVECSFDVIIVDNDEYTDFSYMNEIRKNSKMKNIPVVIITSQASKDIVLKAISIGVAGILLRPISIDNMKRSIEKALYPI